VAMPAPTTAGESVALSREDLAILSKESETVVGHACKVILVGPVLDVGELRESMRRRIEAVPSLSRRLGGTTAVPAWVPDPGFQLDDHVVDATGATALTAADLDRELARLFVQRLDRNKPLWQIDVLGPLEDGGSALVWRVHHAMADGQTSMRYAAALIWDEVDASSAPVSSVRAAAASAELHHERHRRDLAGFVDREFRRGVGPSPFDGQIGAQRSVAFTTAGLASLRRVAKAVADATVNDAVLACVAGGLRRWMGSGEGQLRELRVKVPVSLHHSSDDLGNRDSCFYLGLPVGEPDPATRLRLIRQESALRKANHDAEEMDRVLAELGRVSPRLRLLCERFQFDPREFALNVSNVPGPRAPVSVVGRPVHALYAIADIAERHALRVGAISYGDQLNFGLCADAALVQDLPALAVAIRAEADDLVALAP
jgi:diacylglycerol O-acyltransferase